MSYSLNLYASSWKKLDTSECFLSNNNPILEPKTNTCYTWKRNYHQIHRVYIRNNELFFIGKLQLAQPGYTWNNSGDINRALKDNTFVKKNIKFKKSSNPPVLSSNFWSRKPDHFDVTITNDKHKNLKCFGFWDGSTAGFGSNKRHNFYGLICNTRGNEYSTDKKKEILNHFYINHEYIQTVSRPWNKNISKENQNPNNSQNNNDNLKKAADAYSKGDFQTAITYLNPLAEQGDAAAQYNLGFLYMKGKGVPQDIKMVIKWYTKAAKQGYANAQFNLGLLYELGQDVPRDYKMAIKWYTKAAEQGQLKAQNNLGHMYKGVLQDNKMAFKWYAKAAEQGNAVAQFNLGLMYEKGEGVPQDYKMAFKWYTKSAEQGVASAQNNLGNIYKEGRVVPQDYVKAHMWYNIASQSNEFAMKEIANLSKEHVEEQMTPIQITKAQKLASQCYTKKFKGC